MKRLLLPMLPLAMAGFLNPMLAGAAHMDQRRFTLASVVGAIVWVPTLVLLGYYGAGVLEKRAAGRGRRHALAAAGEEGRAERLQAIAGRPETIVLYESPHRLAATLRDLAHRLVATSDIEGTHR